MTGRVLLLTKTDFAVPRDGGTLRVAAIVSALRTTGFTVDAVAVRTSAGRRHGQGLRTSPRSLTDRRWWGAALTVGAAVARIGSLSVARWYSPSAGQRIAELLERHDYDAVVIEYSQLLAYRNLFGDLPVVLDMHNVEYELLANYALSTRSAPRRILARYETARVRNLELRCGELTDSVVTVSEHDAHLIRPARAGAHIVTAPNGVADDAFETTAAAAEGGPVVFIGNLGWQPNVDAAHWLVREVWPTIRRRNPSARLQLIGKSPARSLLDYDGLDGVSVHPDVPSTLPYLSGAVVATAPLLAAGGTRLKILEAMATGTAVVSTSLGALGLDHLARSGAMTIADEPTAFADAVCAYMAAKPDPAMVRAQADPYRWSRALQALTDAVGDCARRLSAFEDGSSRS